MVVLYLVESTKLQTVDKSIILKNQQLLILPRIALENYIKILISTVLLSFINIYGNLLDHDKNLL